MAIALGMLLSAAVLPAAPAAAQGPANFVFTGRGWGHGVGMSQNGARNMADQGADHVAILAHYYPNTVVSQTAPLGDIRVHIGDASRIEMTSGGPLTFERNGTVLTSSVGGAVQVIAHDGGLQIGDRWTTGAANDPVFVSFPQPVKISNNGHSYLWGKIQLTNHDGKVRVVEVLPLEQYVAGIAEMPAAWPLEALMAQAIAARTYAHEVTLHRRSSVEWAQEYDISGTTIDQNYIGWDAQDSAWDQRWTAAVSATAGVEIVDNNGPIRAYYSASNGGWTETAAYVFNNDVPYTVAGPDPFDAGGHNWSEWTRTYSQTAMSRWLNAYPDTAVGTLTAINVLGGQGASARLDKATVELVGTSTTKRVTGKRLMVVMNAGIFGQGLGLDDHLPGTFTTIGNGAGVGLPEPSGAQVVAQVTPDPLPSADANSEAFTPPPGWRPEPGTGVPPLAVVDESASDAADDARPAGFAPVATPVPGDYRPDPASGVAPIPIDDAAPFSPDPTTGVAPIPVAEAEVEAEPSDEAPAPDPASGVAPVPVAETETVETAPADAGSGAAAVSPDPASAVAPVPVESGGVDSAPPAAFRPDPASGVAPVPVDAVPAAATTTPDTTTPDTTTVGGTGGGDASGGATSDGLSVPSGFTPVPGTGVAPVPVTNVADDVLVLVPSEDSADHPNLEHLDTIYCSDTDTTPACVILRAIVANRNG